MTHCSISKLNKKKNNLKHQKHFAMKYPINNWNMKRLITCMIYFLTTSDLMCSFYYKIIPPNIILYIRTSRSPLISEMNAIPSGIEEPCVYFSSNLCICQGISVTDTVLYCVVPAWPFASLFVAHKTLKSWVCVCFPFY